MNSLSDREETFPRGWIEPASSPGRRMTRARRRAFDLFISQTPKPRELLQKLTALDRFPTLLYLPTTMPPSTNHVASLFTRRAPPPKVGRDRTGDHRRQTFFVKRFCATPRALLRGAELVNPFETKNYFKDDFHGRNFFFFFGFSMSNCLNKRNV